MTPRGRRSRPQQGQRTGRAASRNHEECQQLLPDPEQITRCAGPGTYTFAGDAHCLARPSLRCPRPQWSRPVRIDVCSMFARMSRYAPALLGIRSAARMRAAGRSGSSWYVLALFDSSSKRISEQSSGLLIRGFGVRVPGGAPVLTWGFIAPGHFLCVRFVPMLAPRSLVSHEPGSWRARQNQPNRPHPGADGPPRSLDQWSIPLPSTPSIGCWYSYAA